MTRINITITEPEFAAIHRLADVSGLGFVEIIRRALDQYIAAPDIVVLPQEEGHEHIAAVSALAC